MTSDILLVTDVTATPTFCEESAKKKKVQINIIPRTREVENQLKVTIVGSDHFVEVIRKPKVAATI